MRYTILFLVIIAAVGCRSAMLRSPGLNQSEKNADGQRIQGTWRFQKEVDSDLNGDVVVIPGPAYEGQLVYTSDGFMSTIVMPRNRSWDAATATVEQLRESVAEGSSTAYTGRYEIDPVAHTVAHTILASVDPADEGRRLIRNYVLNGDTLLLSGNWTYRDAPLRFTVFWMRAF